VQGLRHGNTGFRWLPGLCLVHSLRRSRVPTYRQRSTYEEVRDVLNKLSEEAARPGRIERAQAHRVHLILAEGNRRGEPCIQDV
jgi:hypothetical protein